MNIVTDSREKPRAITKILDEFDRQGVKHHSSKLYVGDYMSLDNARLVIDRKQNLQELAGNVCQQHERFRNELIRARDAGIKIVILCEHGKDIKKLGDVCMWWNPRKKSSPKAISGKQLYGCLCTIRDRYDVRFEFCEKKDTGKRIIEILTEG